MRKIARSAWMIVMAAGICGAASAHEWRNQVPAQESTKTNPYAADAETLAAGSKVFNERCASCHGADALGHGRRPSLQTVRVHEATDGELLWLLKNGELRYGMPSWSGLPEEQRWQVERYVKSLPLAVASSVREPYQGH